MHLHRGRITTGKVFLIGSGFEITTDIRVRCSKCGKIHVFEKESAFQDTWDEEADMGIRTEYSYRFESECIRCGTTLKCTVFVSEYPPGSMEGSPFLECNGCEAIGPDPVKVEYFDNATRINSHNTDSDACPGALPLSMTNERGEKMDILESIFSKEILEKYEIYNYYHAAEILSMAYPEEFKDLLDVLNGVHISIDDLLTAGGNESPIPPKYKEILFPRGWAETRVHGDLNLQLDIRSGETSSQEIKLSDYINGYNIDFFKNKIAIDTEWNSKDQTFDRDLMAFRTYYEFGIISAGVIITRGTDLKSFPKHYGLSKYGASTTWMGKLKYRLDSRRSGGCPMLAIGITSKCIEGFEPD